MKRTVKVGFLLLLLILLVGGIASVFPVTSDYFTRLPYWILYPLRICTAIFLAFMFIGFLIDSGILQRLFGKR